MVLIFDMDGVIVDNHQWHFKAWVEFGKRHWLRITRTEFDKHVGTTNASILNALFSDKLNSKQVNVLSKEKENIYREIYAPHIQPVSGLPEFLQYASDSGIPIALATSAIAENVDFTLDATGLRKYFAHITDASMVKKGKPDPEIYLKTAKKLDVNPAECIVFEDSIAGIIAAQKAGMFAVGLATSFKASDLLNYVNKIIENFEGADKLLPQWWQAANNKPIIP